MEKTAIYEALGQNIRTERVRRKLNQSALADLVGMSRTSITNVELGRQSLLVDQLLRIAEALGTDPQMLLPRLEPRPRPNSAPSLTPELSAWLKDLRAES
jgi:transcriptional regulator with XRE-family HTH domain